MGKFWSYLGGTIIKPHVTFKSLLADPKHLAYGTGAILFIGLLYTLTVIGLTTVSARIVVPPWVAIPAENYYFWEIFFALPVYLVGWILASGIAQLLGRAFKGSGTFEGTVAVLAFAITIPSFVTWIPETTGTILSLLGTMTQDEWIQIITQPGFWKVFSDVYIYVSLGWLLILIPLAIHVAQKLHWWQTAIVSILTIIPTGLLIFLFIR